MSARARLLVLDRRYLPALEDVPIDDDKPSLFSPFERVLRVLAEEDGDVIGVTEYAFYYVWPYKYTYAERPIHALAPVRERALAARLASLLRARRNEEVLAAALALAHPSTPRALWDAAPTVDNVASLASALVEHGMRYARFVGDCVLEDNEFLRSRVLTVLEALDFIGAAARLGIYGEGACVKLGETALGL